MALPLVRRTGLPGTSLLDLAFIFTLAAPEGEAVRWLEQSTNEAP